MSIISAMRTWLQGCPFLDTLAKNNMQIDLTNKNPTNYGLADGGMTKTPNTTYLDGTSQWQGNYILYAKEYTNDDVERLENVGFCEDLQFWITDQSDANNFPEIEGISPVLITADNGQLYDLDESGDTGTYQIQIHFTFRR